MISVSVVPVNMTVKIGDASLFYLCVCFFFCSVYCSENGLKINMTPYGENFIIKLNELKFKSGGMHS